MKSSRLWMSAGLCALASAAAVSGLAALRTPAEADGLGTVASGLRSPESAAFAGVSSSATAAASPDAATASYVELSHHLQNYPSDHRAWAIKARLDARAARFVDAAAAYKAALSGRSKVALDPNVWVEFAEALAMSRGGSLAGEPRQHLDRAFALQPSHPGALDLAAAAAWDSGDFELAATYWKRLLPQLSAGDPQRSAVQAALERAQRKARFALPRRGALTEASALDTTTSAR